MPFCVCVCLSASAPGLKSVRKRPSCDVTDRLCQCPVSRSDPNSDPRPPPPPWTRSLLTEVDQLTQSEKKQKQAGPAARHVVEHVLFAQGISPSPRHVHRARVARQHWAARCHPQVQAGAALRPPLLAVLPAATAPSLPASLPLPRLRPLTNSPAPATRHRPTHPIPIPAANEPTGRHFHARAADEPRLRGL